MSLYSMFKTDSKKENEGIPIRIPTGDGEEAVFFIGRMSKQNKEFAKASERVFKPHRKLQSMGLLSDAKTEMLARTAFIQGCLKGWENVKGPKGEILEFTEDNAQKLFADLPQLYEDLATEALNQANYSAEDLEDSTGN